MLLTYRYRVKDGQRIVRRTLRQQARSVNFVWNFCAATDREAVSRYRAGSNVKRPTAFDLATLCRGVTRELGIHSDTIDAICSRFADARRACFPKTPRFRSAKRNLDWIPFSNFTRPACLIGDTLTVLRHKYRLWLSRTIPETGKAKSFNLATDSEGHWFVNIQIELPDAERRDGDAVGIDLGLNTLATLSDGTKIEPPRFYRRVQEKLALHQRRRQKHRARRLVAKVARQRRHFLHEKTTGLARQYGTIIIGNVNSSRLGKTRMAKSVYDAGWAMFKAMLKYKAIAHGIEVKIVNEAWSSQTCSCCGSVPDTRPKGIAGLSERCWICSDCGASHDRDVNAALNILRFGVEHGAPLGEIPGL